jgi:hypothetical protein
MSDYNAILHLFFFASLAVLYYEFLGAGAASGG